MKHGIYAFAVITGLSILTFSVSLSGQVLQWEMQLEADHALWSEKADQETVQKAEKHFR